MVDQTISEPAHPRPGQGGPAAAAAHLGQRGSACVDGTALRAMLGEAGSADWDGFARSREDLGPDRSMADGGHYRKRRYAGLKATTSWC